MDKRIPDAPASFAESVRLAARSAVAQPPAKRPRVRTVLLLTVFLLAAGSAIAAVHNWLAGDLFTEQDGFMLPTYEWGSSASEPREDSLILYGYTADVMYQYENDRLIGVDIVFNRENQPDSAIRAELYERLVADMRASFSPVTQEQPAVQYDVEGLQKALREYLGYTDEESEGERIRRALSEAGADPDLTEMAVLWAENSHTEAGHLSWYDPATGTAIALQVFRDGQTQEIRSLRLSLAGRLRLPAPTA